MYQTLPRSKRYFKIFKKSVKSWGKGQKQIIFFPRRVAWKKGRWFLGCLMHHCIYKRIKRITFSTVRENITSVSITMGLKRFLKEHSRFYRIMFYCNIFFQTIWCTVNTFTVCVLLTLKLSSIFPPKFEMVVMNLIMFNEHCSLATQACYFKTDHLDTSVLFWKSCHCC